MTSSYQKSLGGILIVSSLMTIVLMANHPTDFRAPLWIGLIHGGLLALLLVSTATIIFLAGDSQTRHPLMVLAVLSLVWGSLANLTAGTMNGFITPQLFLKLDETQLAIVLPLCWSINQTATAVGIVTTSLSFCLIGLLEYFRKHTPIAGWLAGTGLLFVTLSVGILAAHRGHTDAHAALVIYTFQALWQLLLGGQRIFMKK